MLGPACEACTRSSSSSSPRPRLAAPRRVVARAQPRRLLHTATRLDSSETMKPCICNLQSLACRLLPVLSAQSTTAAAGCCGQHTIARIWPSACLVRPFPTKLAAICSHTTQQATLVEPHARPPQTSLSLHQPYARSPRSSAAASAPCCRVGEAIDGLYTDGAISPKLVRRCYDGFTLDSHTSLAGTALESPSGRPLICPLRAVVGAAR
jgi:hypothetical protein